MCTSAPLSAALAARYDARSVVQRCASANFIRSRVADAESQRKFRFSRAATTPCIATIAVLASGNVRSGTLVGDAHAGEIDAARNLGAHDTARPGDGIG